MVACHNEWRGARPGGVVMASKQTAGGTGRTKKAASTGSAVRVYTLEVFLIGGPVTQGLVKSNPVVSRTIESRGDQTLQELHDAIFDAFGRQEQHAYEFQFGGKGA